MDEPRSGEASGSCLPDLPLLALLSASSSFIFGGRHDSGVVELMMQEEKKKRESINNKYLKCTQSENRHTMGTVCDCYFSCVHSNVGDC